MGGACARRPKTRGGLSMYICGQFSRWSGYTTRTHAQQYKPLGSCLTSRPRGAISSSTWLSALIALGRRNQSSYLCTGFPGTVPISWPPDLQTLLKPDAAEFQDGFPPDMPNLKFQLPSPPQAPKAPTWKRLGREENQPWRRDEQQMLLFTQSNSKPSTQQTPSARLALPLRLMGIRSTESSQQP